MHTYLQLTFRRLKYIQIFILILKICLLIIKNRIVKYVKKKILNINLCSIWHNQSGMLTIPPLPQRNQKRYQYRYLVFFNQSADWQDNPAISSGESKMTNTR